ncbi:MAG TPA: ferritin-like domain-containing protein [Pseudonocardiaceae bacterium]
MGDGRIDTRLLTELTVQSQDLNSDAVRITQQALGEFTEEGREGSGRRWGSAGLFAGLVGAGIVAGAGRAMAATADTDVQALQTAASIENLAVSVYQTAAGLSFIKTGNATVLAFIAKTTTQHQAHAQAFNAAITSAGAKTQSNPDPKYAAVVQQMLPSIKGPSDVVKLAITLEDVAAQTYTKNVGEVSSAALRKLFGSVAPVEAQHRAVLLAVQALLAGNAVGLIAVPTQPAMLPAAAGSVGFPDSFYATSSASPVSEGAVQ